MLKRHHCGFKEENFPLTLEALSRKTRYCGIITKLVLIDCQGSVYKEGMLCFAKKSFWTLKTETKVTEWLLTYLMTPREKSLVVCLYLHMAFLQKNP